MRFIIFIFFLSLSLTSKANEFCDSNESISFISEGDKLILKCDCNCTNEENRFYINSITTIEASRLISLDGISKTTFDKLKHDKKVCKWENYTQSYKNNLIFAVKVPDGNNSCFEIKEHFLNDSKKTNLPIYYLVNRTGYFNQIRVNDIDESLKYFGVNELSNRLLNENNRNDKLLNKGDVVKSEYSLNGKSIVKRDGLFFEVGNDYLDPYFYMNSKSYLYSKPNEINKSNMYLVKGDRIKIMDESINHSVRWYFINYKGKKEINMWIKADSVDLNE